MGKLKEVLRLKWEEKKGNREVGRIVGINHKTVGVYLKKAEEAGVSSLKQIEALTLMILGHTKIETTQRYMHLYDDIIRKTVSKKRVKAKEIKFLELDEDD